MQIASYNLDDYANIIFTGIHYSMPDNITRIIQTLTSELGVSCIVTQSSYGEHDVNSKRLSPTNLIRRNKSNGGNKRMSMEDESWEKLKKFQSTKIDKKEGFEKLVNDICVCLNKISNKNYDTQRDSIFQLIRDSSVFNETNQEETDEPDEPEQNKNNLKKISNAIFNIASTNKFYSDVYANLYKELITEFPVFNDIVGVFIQQYLDCVRHIQFVDQNTDYDKYCDNNKLNDKRKAMAAFIVNLMARDVIEKSKVLNIIVQLEEMVLTYINEPDRLCEVEEITENIYIFVTMSIGILYTEEGWTDIAATIQNCSQFKSKEYKSLSSRAVFKYMDINDFIKKNTK